MPTTETAAAPGDGVKTIGYWRAAASNSLPLSSTAWLERAKSNPSRCFSDLPAWRAGSIGVREREKSGKRGSGAEPVGAGADTATASAEWVVDRPLVGM